MTEHASLPVFASVRAAWAFFTAHWRLFLFPAFLLALGVFMATEGGAAMNANVAAIGLGLWAVMSVLYPAAVYRFALRGEYGGLYGLRVGAEEGRLALLSFLFTLFLLLVVFAAGTPLLLLVAAVVMAAGDPEGLQAAQGDPELAIAAMGPEAVLAFQLGLIAIMCLILFVGARLALSAPATVGEGRFLFLKTWPWTKGVFFRLVAVLILAALPGVAIDFFLGTMGRTVAAAGAQIPGMALIFAGSFGNALVGIMMSCAALAYLYRGLRPAESNVPA